MLHILLEMGLFSVILNSQKCFKPLKRLLTNLKIFPGPSEKVHALEILCSRRYVCGLPETRLKCVKMQQLKRNIFYLLAVT